MFAKRLLKKAIHRHQVPHRKKHTLTSEEVNLRINVHYGIPCTSSILAFDPIQRLLAIGTLDGRIKVIGGDNIEGLLVSPKLSPYKYLEFLQNKGLLISITNDNDIQVWNLERRSIACSFQWDSNVTAFSVISGSLFMYVGDEYGFICVLKYDVDLEQLVKLQYQLSLQSLAEAAGFSISSHQLVVGVLPQPCSSENRLLIAYEGGPIILWDVIESHVVALRGDKALQLKSKVVASNDADNKLLDDEAVVDLEEKEISALCWTSVDILAVGYVNGDVLFWDTSKTASISNSEVGLSHSVVKLKLSASEKRLPVIVLRWVDNSKSRNHKGLLIVYGGDEIGCEEIVTVLSLEWSPGIETLKCVGRLNLTLTGSFSDIILVPSAGTIRIDKDASLFVLLNPGRVYIYDIGRLSSSNLPGKELPVSAVNFPTTIPSFDPLMTVAELFHIRGGSKITAVSSTLTRLGNQKWPLTGGVSNHLRLDKDNKINRLYVAGYQDGSVRIWDATYPVFSLLCVLTNEGDSEKLAGFGSSVTLVDLCTSSLRLAIGRECGLVQLYDLYGGDGTSIYFVTEMKSEVHSSLQVQGPRCRAIFDLRNSKVQALKFANNGSKLIVGYECSQVAVLDVDSSSVAFITDSLNSPGIPVISILWKSFAHVTSEKGGETSPKFLNNSTGEFIFVLTKDGNIYVIDGNNGILISSKPACLKKQSSAICIHLIESQTEVSSSLDEKLVDKDHVSSSEISIDNAQESERFEPDDNILDKVPSAASLKDFSILLCCKDSLRIYPAKSVVQGNRKSICKAKLSKPCCWTTVLRKDKKVCGLVVFYLTGVMEIRSLPDLEVVKEIALMLDLRWTVKANMERMIGSLDNGLIALANGCEVTLISVLEGDNDFRLPESLPSLHDEVLAAAANAAISSGPKRKQRVSSCILGGFVKGLKGQKSNKLKDQNFISSSSFSHLDDIFMRNSFPEQSADVYKQETSDLNIEDIEIDEPLPSVSASSQVVNNKDKDKKSELEKLFDGGDDIRPRLRTREEIIAKYRKAGDSSSAAGEARNKLLERQEKLEKIARRMEDLRNEAEDFASLANELVKVMEKRKWYHI